MGANELFQPSSSMSETVITHIYEGYAYQLDKRTEQQFYLACIQTDDKELKCNGRCNGKSKHNHKPDSTLKQKSKSQDALHATAQQNVDNLREYYEKCSKEYPPTSSSKTAYNSLAKKFQKWRAATIAGKEPSSKKTNKLTRSKTEDHPSKEIINLQHFLMILDKNQQWLTYNANVSKRQRRQYHITPNLVRDKKYVHLVIYDGDLMEVIGDAKSIIIHKMNSILPATCGTHVVNIMFEKYEKALTGCWLLMGGTEELSYRKLFTYLKMIFPFFNPNQAVVDYDKNLQNGLKAVFPDIEIIPSLLDQIKIIFENGIQTNAAKTMNRVKNADNYAVLRKFMALSLLPKHDILPTYDRLVAECNKKYGTYFDLFIVYYYKKWMNGWKPDCFSVYRQDNLTRNFLECFNYRKNFQLGLKLDPFSFLEKVQTVLINARTDLDVLEQGDNILYYLKPEDAKRERKLYKTWDRLDNGTISAYECLIICSNLLNEDFLDSLAKFFMEDKTECNRMNSEPPEANYEERINISETVYYYS